MSMNWKTFSSKPRMPKTEVTYTIDPKHGVIDNPDLKGSVIVYAMEGKHQVRLALWNSQAADICDFLDRFDFKKPIKVVFHKERDTNRRFPALVEENSE